MYKDVHLFSSKGTYEGCLSDWDGKGVFHSADNGMTKVVPDSAEFVRHSGWRAFVMRQRHPTRFREFEVFEVGCNRTVGSIDFSAGSWVAWVKGDRLGDFPFVSDAIAALIAFDKEVAA